jgi:metal-sulfur cluster biosynthetic enzyme
MAKSGKIKITKKLVEAKLKNVIDPELGINIVDLGLIYKIKVSHTNLTSRQRLPASRSRRAIVRDSGVPANFSDEKSRLVRTTNNQQLITILMTLTSPGCPLAAVFQPLVRQAMADIPGFDQYKDLVLELTFDPPWHQDMMSERAKAELDF